MSYDSWKTATPPEYEEGGPDPVDEAMERAEEVPWATLCLELEEIAERFPALREKAEDAIRTVRFTRGAV